MSLCIHTGVAIYCSGHQLKIMRSERAVHPAVLTSQYGIKFSYSVRWCCLFQISAVWDWISISHLFLNKLMPYILYMCTHIYPIKLSVSLKDADLNYIQAYNEASILDQSKSPIQGTKFLNISKVAFACISYSHQLSLWISL